LVPLLLPGWSAVAVTTGRYLAYGLLSVLLFTAGGRVMRGLARRHWRPALAFAIAGNAGYYLLLVLGIDLIGAPVTDMIIGCIPVTLALVANLIWHAHRWRKLAVPIALATTGLLLATLPGGQAPASSGRSAAAELFGLLAAFGAVALWDLVRAGQRQVPHQIMALTADGLNLAGVRRVVELQEETRRLQAEIEQLKAAARGRPVDKASPHHAGLAEGRDTSG
jgi:drug/metabolite transporter (DMT)-like permease